MLISQGKLAGKDKLVGEAYVASSKKTRSRCYKCGKRGHLARDCKSEDRGSNKSKDTKDKKDRDDASSDSDTSEKSTRKGHAAAATTLSPRIGAF